MKAEVANNRGRRTERGKQGKQGVGMNGYKIGLNNGGVGIREVVVAKKGMKGRSGRKEMRQRELFCYLSYFVHYRHKTRHSLIV